ncbi:helix-turn-helix domain-containing protein [Enterococcus faecalis]|uniref:helix-turn-helix domain-containing protein n=1 Tax=Enterococcus faecalis TaxID=1351 RepID=UPI000A19EB0B|nr:helix-turn-helix transcriptional regulator [Enterococcus faecalis]OSM18491.1 hypothetical protein B6S40_07310 [Enterococcus faecalis]HAP3844707.1 helix-turn-helix transcriptional regulator [Enterococcus faecalis]
MEKKQINTLVKQLRMDVGLKQKEARKGVMEAAAYSRFENGKKSIDFTTLLAILSNLRVSLKDFIEMYIEPNLERTTRDFFVSCYHQLPSDEALNKIFCLYDDLSKKYPNLDIDELTVYFDIKAMFHKENPERIPSITPKEQSDVLKRFYNLKNAILFEEDYRLIGQIVNDISTDKIMEVMEIILSKCENTKLSEKSKQHVCNFILNGLTALFYRQQYDEIKVILDIIEKMGFLYQSNYFYLSQIAYLKNLYLYLAKNDIYAFKKVNEIINSISIIGDEQTSQQMLVELQNLVNNKKHIGLSQYDIAIGKK